MISYRLVRYYGTGYPHLTVKMRDWLKTLPSCNYDWRGRDLSFTDEDDAIIFKLKFPELIY